MNLFLALKKQSRFFKYIVIFAIAPQFIFATHPTELSQRIEQVRKEREVLVEEQQSPYLLLLDSPISGTTTAI